MTCKKLSISSVSELASLLEVSVSRLYSIAESAADYYGKKIEPKKSGGTRTLFPPRFPLKGIQQKLHKIISSRTDPYSSSHFGIKRRSNVTNAKRHLRSREGLTCDLKSFFPSIRPERVVKALVDEQGCGPEVARIMTKLVTYKFQLPQGAPTSSDIANIVTMKLQRRLNGLAKRYNLKFTIYADDITFSGTRVHDGMFRRVIEIVKSEGFKVHPQKGGFFNKTDCQLITGVNISHGASVGNLKKRWRAELHNAKIAFERNDITPEQYLVAEQRYSSRIIYSKYVCKISVG